MLKWLASVGAGLALAAACVSEDGKSAAGAGGSGGTGGSSAGTGGSSGTEGGVVCYDSSYSAGVGISVFDAVTCAPVAAHFVVDGWNGGANSGNCYHSRAPDGCYAVQISAPGYQSRQIVVYIDGMDEHGCGHGSNNAITVVLTPLDGGAALDADVGDADAEVGDAPSVPALQCGTVPTSSTACSDHGDLNCGAPVTPEAGPG